MYGSSITKVARYEILVTNHGPMAATNVLVEENLELTAGVLVELLESEMKVTHGGHWIVDSITGSAARLTAEIPSLSTGETATLEFAAIVVISFAHPGGQADAILRNTAVVSSDTEDSETGNNRVNQEIGL